MIDLGSAQHYANVVRIHETVQRAAAEHYRNRGRVFVDVPQIVDITGACENIDTLFGVLTRSEDDLFFSQTGQLHLEAALASFPAVWTRIHSGRDEAGEDERHLREFTLTEEELSAGSLGMNLDHYDAEVMHEKLLDAIEAVIQAVLDAVLHEHELLIASYGRDLNELRLAEGCYFPTVPYDEAIVMLQQYGYPVSFGDDLTAEHEAALVRGFSGGDKPLPIFVTRFPKDIKFFNMAVSRLDERVCLSADLILPFAGEAAGAAVREHDYDRLLSRLLHSRMYSTHVARGGSLDDFRWYLDLVKSQATQPHAGYGLGNDRLVQYILGLSDIRSASPLAMLKAKTRMEASRT